MHRPAQSELASLNPGGDSGHPPPRVETQTISAPHNAVKAESLSVFVGARCLLAETDLKIAEQQRTLEVKTSQGGTKQVRGGMCYGLVGPNGCGKSTLLRLIAEGAIPTPHTWDVLLVSQQLPAPTERGAVEEVLSGDARRAELLQRQAALEHEVAAAALEEGDAEHIRTLSDQLLEVENELSKWDNDAEEVTTILVALGFRKAGSRNVHCSAPSVDTAMRELSGGWRMKVELAKALWLQPKLLLLDEPTNHLDSHALLWLEGKLEEYPHTSVVVSHDVSFLHSSCREILWINDKAIESMPRDMVSHEDMVRMQRRRPPSFKFTTPEGGAPEDHGLSLHGVEFRYNSNKASRVGAPTVQVQGDVRFSGNSRAVLLGRNGSGKSTFLDLCIGKIEPSRGTVDRTAGCQIGYYSQQSEDLDRDGEQTAAAYLVRQCRDILEGRVDVRARAAEARGRVQQAALEKKLLEASRGVLSNFGFDGDVAVTVPVSRLSGGQRACLKFAVLSLRPAHILVLDEPSNHLDAEACEALAKGLSEFRGGVVVVTHDDTLIYRIFQCNCSHGELFICEGGGVRREHDTGAYATREQVRKAEEREAVVGRRPKPTRVLAARNPVPNVPKRASAPIAVGDRKTLDEFKGSESAARVHDKKASTSGQRSKGKRAVSQAETTASPGQDQQGELGSLSCASVRLDGADVMSPRASWTCRACTFLNEKAHALVCSICQTNRFEAPVPQQSEVHESPQALLPLELQSTLEVSIRNDDHHGSEDVDNYVRKGQSPKVENWEELALSDCSPDRKCRADRIVCEGTGPACWEELASCDDKTPSASCKEGTPCGSAKVQAFCCEGITCEVTKVLESSKDSGTCEIPQVAISGPASQGCSAECVPLGRGSGHSRSRKDLVNLSKAVLKWTKQERRGEISHGQIVENIVKSTAARRLRSLHGAQFREEDFVQDLLMRVARSEM